MAICKVPADKIKEMKDSIEKSFTTLKDVEGIYRSSGLSPMRFRWDIFNTALGARWTCDNIYRMNGVDTDINDTHLDTALRQIMKELGLEWGASKT